MLPENLFGKDGKSSRANWNRHTREIIEDEAPKTFKKRKKKTGALLRMRRHAHTHTHPMTNSPHVLKCLSSETVNAPRQLVKLHKNHVGARCNPIFCCFLSLRPPLFKGAPTILVIRLIYVFSSGSLRDEIIGDKSVTNKSLGGRKTNKNRRKSKEEERDVVIERGTTESNGMGRLLLLSYA